MQRLRINKKGKILATAIFIAVLSFGFISSSEKDFKIAKNLDIFVTLFREINNLYVDDIDPEEIIESGINGMLKSLDPYTNFIPEKDVDEFKFMTTGKYGGIGALIRKAGSYTMVSEPYEGFPAQKAGLIAGDTIISIDGFSTKDKNISDVSELLKGTPNTEVELRIKRLGTDSIIKKSFMRQQVSIANVPYYGMLPNEKIGYIVLSNFMKGAAKEVKEAFKDLESQGAQAVILDLRGNPGGLLNEAVDIANIWIPKNQEIVSTRGKVTQWDKSYKTQNQPIDTVMPLAVLVNRGSASASEIVSGSLQDLDRAIIIGQKTFGKGLVQTTRPLSYNTHLKVTTAKYYIPSGRCIQALDYSNRNADGSVGHIPDSLISEFKTVNGRSVFDGGGIDPDIKMKNEEPGNITLELYAKNFIFDFATEYAYKHKSILLAPDFEINDDIYSEFKQFLADKKFEYSTMSSEKLTELIKTSKREGYYEVIEDELDGLKDKLHGNREKDLETFGVEIKELLRDEIVSRYYYQKGRIMANLQDDHEVKKAVDLLNDGQAVAKILHGNYQGETVFAIRTH